MKFSQQSNISPLTFFFFYRYDVRISDGGVDEDGDDGGVYGDVLTIMFSRFLWLTCLKCRLVVKKGLRIVLWDSGTEGVYLHMP